jgi:hypothetical protein
MLISDRLTDVKGVHLHAGRYVEVLHRHDSYVSLITLDGSLSLRKPTNFVCRK